MSKKTIIFLCFWAYSFSIYAQETKLTNAFKFETGIFLSFESFKQNKPDYTWMELYPSAYVNEEKYIAKFEYINYWDTITNTEITIALDSVWAVCVNGLPYVKVYDVDSTIQFNGLKTRGKLCYFTYERIEKKNVPMRIFDPYTGNVVITTEMEKEEKVNTEYILQFETGEILPFTFENLLKSIADDEQLMTTLKEMSAVEAEEKLYKSMLIYNDRNAVFMEK